MKLPYYIIALCWMSLCWSCQQNASVVPQPLEALAPIDQLLEALAESPQTFTVSSSKTSTVTGAEGTVVYVDPSRLETVDGTPLGADIEVALLEMTDKGSLLLQRAPTTSNGKLLETGGAYYLNMTSVGKQLQIKTGKGLEVEFPKLTNTPMALFNGARDSMGNINWAPLEQPLKKKKLKKPTKPEASETTEKKVYSELELIMGHISGRKRKPLTEAERKVYERKMREYETAKKTYKMVDLMELGWINCDRFLNDPEPKVTVELLVADDSITAVRMYALFEDINSIMATEYWKGMFYKPSFLNLPIGREIKVIALAVKDETPYFFETVVEVAKDQPIQIQLAPTTQAALKQHLEQMN